MRVYVRGGARRAFAGAGDRRGQEPQAVFISRAGGTTNLIQAAQFLLPTQKDAGSVYTFSCGRRFGPAFIRSAPTPVADRRCGVNGPEWETTAPRRLEFTNV